MTWCDKSSCDNDHHMAIICDTKANEFLNMTCPSCGHNFGVQDQSGGIQALPGLPAGVKFDPTDQEILEHLEAKVLADKRKLHPLINEFIPTIEGENGICYTHPENLPGVSNDGQVRHFFHRPSKAYTTGTRKRRKVHSDEEDGSETRWHKTGKTRPVLISGGVKGFKKILVLYTNYGRQKKPEKTNWVMHQYHLGNSEEEKEGELVLSKVFYQTQPRQCGTSNNNSNNVNDGSSLLIDHQNRGGIDYYGGNDPHLVIYGGGGDTETSNRHPYQLIANHVVVQGDGSSLFRLAADTSKGKLQRKY